MDHVKHPAPPKEFILLMATIMSVVAFSIDAMLPALGVIANDLGATNPNHSQFILSSIFAGMALGQLIAGPLSDALGRKPLLFGALGIYFIGSFICFAAPSMEIMLFGRFVQGLGVAGPYVSTMSIVRDKFSGRAMAKTMSLVLMIFIMVPAMAPAIGQGILLVASWHMIFLLYIAYALTVGTWAHFRLEETLPPEKRIPFNIQNIIHGAKEVLSNRTTVSYMICAGFIFGSMVAFLNSCRQIYQDQFGVGEMFALYFALQALAFGVSSMVNSKIVERLGMRYICQRIALTIAATSLVMLGLHALVEIQFWMFFAYTTLLLFCFGMMFGNLNAMALEPMGHIAGIAAAIVGAVSSLISLTLGTIIGQFYNGTLIPIAAGFLILSLLAFAIMRFEQRGSGE